MRRARIPWARVVPFALLGAVLGVFDAPTIQARLHRHWGTSATGLGVGLTIVLVFSAVGVWLALTGMLIVRSPYLSLAPRVRRHGLQLWASTSLLVRVLTLWSYGRHVHVDAEARYVFLLERKLWVLTSTQLVRFRDIAHVSYRFVSVPTTWHWLGRVEDTFESFSVSLKLHDGRSVLLARFVGEGAAGDLGTLVLGDDLWDFEGAQEDESRLFVAQLCELTGADLVAAQRT